MHIQGQELPAHDPKATFHYAASYRLDPTPGRHFVGSELSEAPAHPAGLLPRFDHHSFAGRGEARKLGSNFHHTLVSAGMCLFVYWAYPDVNHVAEFMRAVTGWDVDNEELLRTGERIANLRQAFNIREGLNSVEFRLPDRVIGKPPLKEGPAAGVTVDEDTMMKEYFNAMDWDLKTAKPSLRKLIGLTGLQDVAQDLWR
jgi:aldehyde:ferredoxin oxidoreductase